MDTIITLIFATFRALGGEPEMAAHPREVFGDGWKALRKGLNQQLSARFGTTLGPAPTMSLFVNEVIGLANAAHEAGEDGRLDVSIGAGKIQRLARALEVKQSLVVEEVAHAPVLNEQARRVAAGEVVRDFRGRIMPAETAAIFA